MTRRASTNEVRSDTAACGKSIANDLICKPAADRIVRSCGSALPWLGRVRRGDDYHLSQMGAGVRPRGGSWSGFLLPLATYSFSIPCWRSQRCGSLYGRAGVDPEKPESRSRQTAPSIPPWVWPGKL